MRDPSGRHSKWIQCASFAGQMVVDGLAFASVVGWAQTQLDAINAGGTQQPSALQDRQPRVKDGEETEERLRNGVGTVFVHFVPPGEDDEG